MDGCRRLGVDPLTLDDIIDRSSVLPADEYTTWQLRWLRELDEVANADGAVRAAAHLLKTPVDSAVVASRILAAAVEALQPSSVEFVGPTGIRDRDPLHNGHLQFRPTLGDLPLYGRALETVARHRGIEFHVVTGFCPAELQPTRSRLGSALSRAARATAPIRHFDALTTSRRGSSTTLLLWSGGYGARAVVEGERARGRRVLALRRGSTITQLLDPRPLGWTPVTGAVPVAPLPPLGRVAEDRSRVDLDHIWSQVDDWCRSPGIASSVLEERMSAFLDRIVPVIKDASETLEGDLADQAVADVMVANPSSIEEFAILLAAGRRGITRTLVQHGDHLFPYDGWLVTETNNVERMWCSDPTLLVDLPEAARRHGAAAPVTTTSAHRQLPRRMQIRPSGTVCYVTSLLAGDSATIPPMYFDDAWYHRWQLRLLAAMAARSDAKFVWKALPTADQSRDTILDVVRATPNVTLETRPFTSVLGTVSRVMTDFPSTAAFEAARAGLPLLVISFPRFGELRPRAVEAFGGVVRSCQSEEDAIREFAGFLASPAAKWIVSQAGLEDPPSDNARRGS